MTDQYQLRIDKALIDEYSELHSVVKDICNEITEITLDIDEALKKDPVPTDEIERNQNRILLLTGKLYGVIYSRKQFLEKEASRLKKAEQE